MCIFQPEVGESFLSFKKGDLIILKNNSTGETLLTATWGYGECNGKSGDFHTEMVYILPTLTPPPQDILVSFKKDIVVSGKSMSTKYAGVHTNYNASQRLPKRHQPCPPYNA